MDLKDTILETIEEINTEDVAEEINENLEEKKTAPCIDKKFLEDIRERLLILFYGLQSPNTQNLEIKLDVTLNFLEYLLAKIEEKLNEK